MTNPIMQFMRMVKNGGNPEALILNLLEQRAGNTPIGQNLMQLAKNNDTQSIEQVARNMCKQRGLDFDKEFAAFKQQLGL